MAKTEKQKDKSKKKKVIIGTLCGIAAAALIAGVTIPCVMCHSDPGPGPEPTEMVTVYFCAKAGDEDVVTITAASYQCPKGQRFEFVKDHSTASKVVDGVEWLFNGWVDENDQPILKDRTITGDMTVYADFQQPTEGKVLLKFEIDPSDPDYAQGISIDTPAIEIDKKDTFVNWASKVNATKVTSAGYWDLQWWYMDGHPKTDPMSKDLCIEETTIVHPYFTPPKTIAKHTVKLEKGNQEGDIDIGTETSFEVEEGTTLEEVIGKITPTKVVDGIQYDWQFWTLDLTPPAEGRQPYRKLLTDKVDGNITLYPFFTEPVQEGWSNGKTIEWENFIDTETQEVKEYSKSFVLKENTFEFKTSHFILKDNQQGGDDQKPVVLEKGEWIEASIVDLPGDIDPAALSVELLDFDETAPSKLQMKFTVDKTKISWAYDREVSFNVHFKKNFTKGGQTTTTTETISGFKFKLTEPTIQNADIHYVDADGNRTFTTLPGIKNYSIDSSARSVAGNCYFYMDRELTSDESIEIIIDGPNKDNIKVENITVLPPDGQERSFINFDIGFIKINGIGSDHEARFTMSIVVTHNSTREEVTCSELEGKEFVLHFSRDNNSPYAIAVDNVVSNKDMSSQFSFDIQVENVEEGGAPRFLSGDYMVVKNITRGNAKPDSPQWKKSPIWITNPREDGALEQPEGIPAAGNDTNSITITASLDSLYLVHGYLPETNHDEFTTELEFTFYRGDTKEEHKINTIKKEILFKFDYLPTNYTDETYAKVHSFGVVQTAVNISSGQKEIKTGTAWIVSQQPVVDAEGGTSSQFNLVTSWDVTNEFEAFQNTQKYRDQTFGLVCPSAAKRVMPNDPTEYVLLEDGSDLPVKTDNNDVIEFDLSVPETVTTVHNFNWHLSGTPLFHIGEKWIGPKLGLIKLNTGNVLTDGDHGLSSQFLYSRFFGPQFNTLLAWSRKQGFDPDEGGQITSVYNPGVGGQPTDLPFDTSNYAYGYVGGFNEVNLTLPSGIKTKAMYWKQFEYNVGFGELDLLGPGTYALFCTGDYEKLSISSDADQEQIYHRCPAFAPVLQSEYEYEFFNDAGRGAMFMLRPYAGNSWTLGYPLVAGLNWNGGSWLNAYGCITPYFDSFVYDESRVNENDRNLLKNWLNPIQ